MHDIFWAALIEKVRHSLTSHYSVMSPAYFIPLLDANYIYRLCTLLYGICISCVDFLGGPHVRTLVIAYCLS